ncbi:MAG: type II toxin-antitoxin system HipA family toxin [Candidatus Omnitrophica bacterium]|nr:type II toxin-antitoxin system HipA family toxin [Candidatus Omnitrophota bacterium]
MSFAEVILWGRRIGGVVWDDKKSIANFEYDPMFIKSNIEISPITMPLSAQIYAFPELDLNTFHGLPGLLADSLPDKFGNALIDAWLAKEGKSPKSFNPVERLCYIGKRGMGALEFKPAHGPKNSTLRDINLESLLELASEILSKRSAFKSSFSISTRKKALQDILKVGTSAGGARAKAVIAWNPQTHEIRSGQIIAEPGFSYWILKFDGVAGNIDNQIEYTKGFGLIEYAYYKMALAAGIQMSESRLLEENGRSHFMTKRFDRTENGEKIHMQSLAALAHYDFNQAGAYSYEQAIQVMRKLKLPMLEIEEQFRRTVFNILARNQDDHVKNIAFLMNKAGQWKLSPAFDLIYSYNPSGVWTGMHQMSMNGKRDKFNKNDFIAFADNSSMKKGTAETIIAQVEAAVSKWQKYAQEVNIPAEIINQIAATYRKL